MGQIGTAILLILFSVIVLAVLILAGTFNLFVMLLVALFGVCGVISLISTFKKRKKDKETKKVGEECFATVVRVYPSDGRVVYSSESNNYQINPDYEKWKWLLDRLEVISNYQPGLHNKGLRYVAEVLIYVGSLDKVIVLVEDVDDNVSKYPLNSYFRCKYYDGNVVVEEVVDINEIPDNIKEQLETIKKHMITPEENKIEE